MGDLYLKILTIHDHSWLHSSYLVPLMSWTKDYWPVHLSYIIICGQVLSISSGIWGHPKGWNSNRMRNWRHHEKYLKIISSIWTFVRDQFTLRYWPWLITYGVWSRSFRDSWTNLFLRFLTLTSALSLALFAPLLLGRVQSCCITELKSLSSWTPSSSSPSSSLS